MRKTQGCAWPSGVRRPGASNANWKICREEAKIIGRRVMNFPLIARILSGFCPVLGSISSAEEGSEGKPLAGALPMW
jgi:hypothetical protein